MQKLKQFFVSFSNWLFVGSRLPIIIVAVVLIATTATVLIVSKANGPKTEMVTAYVTIEGFGDADFENRQIKITDGDSIKDIFSLKYPDIYESFKKPLVQYNEFYSFMGFEKTLEKSFSVTIDGLHDNNLDQAYVYGGQTVVIKYN